MIDIPSTEIVEISSIQELREMVDKEISHYQSLSEMYSVQLGEILRASVDEHSEEEWYKKLQLGDKLPKAREKPEKKEKKGGKGKKGGKKASSDWALFKDVHIATGVKGKALLMFEAVEIIKSKLEELQATKSSLEELRNIGLGEDVSYLALVQDGTPRKIVIKPIEADNLGKFSFNRLYSIVKTT